MKYMNNPFIQAIYNIRNLLPAAFQRQAMIMVLLLLVGALMDVFGLAAILPVVTAAMNPAIIHEHPLFSAIYQQVGSPDHLVFLLLLSCFLLAIFIVKNGLSLFISYMQARFAFKIALDMSEKQFGAYYQRGMQYIKADTSGRISYNIINVPYYFASSYFLPTLTIATELVVIISILIGILLFNPLLVGALLLVLAPSFILIYRVLRSRARDIGQTLNNLSPSLWGYVMNAMYGYTDIILANKEQFFLKNYIKNQKAYNEALTKQNIYNNIPSKTNEIFIALGIVAIFLFAILFREQQDHLLILLSLFAGAAYRVMPSSNRIVTSLVSLRTYSFCVDELNRLNEAKQYAFKQVQPIPFTDTIEFRNIAYIYPGAISNTLEQINHTIRKGAIVGIVGESGSGKTTLLNILLRFLEESTGELYVDGIRITSENRQAYQLNIGYVKQDSFISDATIAENVALGEDPASIDHHAVKLALQQAMLLPFTDAQPDGILYKVGENGSRLSGGQKQRLAIARAIYKQAEVLVFDEATSALDTETEQMLSESILTLGNIGKTIVMVAHRITTLKNCDYIIRLKGGKIADICSYDQLSTETQL